MARDNRIDEPNLGPTDAKRQHVVPRMYLAHFAVDGLVSVYDLDTGDSFASSVANVAVRTGFYDVYVGAQKLSTESWLAAIEGAASQIIGHLGADPDVLLTLSTEDEIALSRFICAQMFRVQVFRDEDAAMRQQLVDHLKQAGKAYLERTESPEEAEKIWDAWKTKPDEWFLKEENPYQPAGTVASMLGEVQGFANLLRHMPWRVGFVDSGLALYTSDNAVSRRPIPTVRWAGFPMWRYFWPLTPSVLLQIGPRLTEEGKPGRIRGDFSNWETSYARHVVSENASRFLYGPGPYVPKECASSCLKRIDMQRADDAAGHQNHDPQLSS